MFDSSKVSLEGTHGQLSQWKPQARDDETSERFLSKAECVTIAQRVAQFARVGQDVGVGIQSRWSGHIRWARNRIFGSGDVRENQIFISNGARGATAQISCNQIDDAGLEAAVRRVERLLALNRERAEYQWVDRTVEPMLSPKIWFDDTYALSAQKRAEVAAPLIHAARSAGVHSAGYIGVSAYGHAQIDSSDRILYIPYTKAQYSITVRDPQGEGSGWAGVDFNDWSRIDTTALSQRALEKCLQSKKPVAVEPGRYTVILEPQAVCDLFSPVIERAMDRATAEQHGSKAPFSQGNGDSKIGQQVLDRRISVSADPMDPDLGFLPSTSFSTVFHPVTWIERGVLKELAYDRNYAIRELGNNTGLPNSGAFRMSGGTTSVDDMIATTQRGILVTRLSNIQILSFENLLLTGYTRDGVWLIERGKISKAIKNLRFTESPLFVFNSVEQLGIPQRVFRPNAPAVVPATKVRDFSFTSLTDAI